MDNKDVKDLYTARATIEKMIAEIGKCRKQIEEKGKVRAAAIKNYDMRLAIAIATIRDQTHYKLAEKQYERPPATVTEKIAKGMVALDREQMELAESGYKAVISNLEALKAQLNAMQSIYRHME